MSTLHTKALSWFEGDKFITLEERTPRSLKINEYITYIEKSLEIDQNTIDPNFIYNYISLYTLIIFSFGCEGVEVLFDSIEIQLTLEERNSLKRWKLFYIELYGNLLTSKDAISHDLSIFLSGFKNELKAISLNGLKYGFFQREDCNNILEILNKKSVTYESGSMTLSTTKVPWETGRYSIERAIKEYLEGYDAYLESFFLQGGFQLGYLGKLTSYAVDVSPYSGLVRGIFNYREYNGVVILDKVTSTYMYKVVGVIFMPIPDILPVEFLLTVAVLSSEGGVYSSIRAAHKAADIL